MRWRYQNFLGSALGKGLEGSEGWAHQDEIVITDEQGTLQPTVFLMRAWG